MSEAVDLQEAQHLVRSAAWALADAGLVGPFGHCSMRLDRDTFLVCASRPMGLILGSDDGTVVPVQGALPAGVLGEVRMHQQIYARRQDVNAICRFLSPQVMALAAIGETPRARHGFSSYFYPQVPFWRDTALVRNDKAAAGVAETLGDANAVVVGVNGAVTAADSMPKAVALAWFLEDAARVELVARSSGAAFHVTFASESSAKERATWDGRIADRAWEWLTSPRSTHAGSQPVRAGRT